MKRRRWKECTISLVYITILTISISSCRKDLNFISAELSLNATIDSADLSVLWGDDWQKKITFPWDYERDGCIGYGETPNDVRINLFTQNGEHFSYSYCMNKYAGLTPITLNPGTYSLSFYNYQTEKIIVNPADNGSQVATTRKSSRILSYANRISDTITIAASPDPLYISTLQNIDIGKDYDSYTLSENKWVKTLNINLTPAVFITLIQITLRNNNGSIIGASALYLSGMAGDINILSGKSGKESVYFTAEKLYFANDSLICSKVLSFGLCEMDNYTRSNKIITRQDIKNTVVITLNFKNGKQQNIETDVTELVRANPSGGPISIELDVSKVISDQENNDNDDNGHFEIDVNHWGNIIHVGIDI